MTVKPESLDNQERGLDLATREAGEGKKAGQKRDDAAPAELRALRDRIAAGLKTLPKDPIPHCGDCYRRGWEAALRTLEG